MPIDFKVGRLIALPGSKVQGTLSVENSELQLPITLINGETSGKTIVITAGTHGGEYPGIETAIRLANELDPKNVSGRIAIVHVVNMPAFHAKMQYVGPDDGKNLNRVFPGKALGTTSEKIAYTITTQLYAQADFQMDLHGGDLHEALVPFVLYPSGVQEDIVNASKEAASLMGIRYVVGSISTNGTYGSATTMGLPGFLAEIGQCGLWNEEAVTGYLRGLKNVLKYFKVIPGEVEDYGAVTYLPKLAGVNADHAGCWYPTVQLDERVSKGQKLGEIRDYFAKTLSEYFAPQDGVALYVVTSLAINAGDPLVGIG